MNTEELIVQSALAAMLKAMPPQLRATCEAEIAAGVHPPGMHLQHRSGRRYEVIWAGRHMGTLLWPSAARSAQ